MHLNKSFIRYFLFYAALVSLLAFRSIEPAHTLLNRLAIQSGLKRYGINGYEANWTAYIAFVLLGVGAAIGLSYLYPNLAAKPSENNDNKGRVRYHITYQKWREWQPKGKND